MTSQLARKMKFCFARSGLTFLYELTRMCTCELNDRWVQLNLPLHSSHFWPSTNTIGSHRRPRLHETIRSMKKELLPKNESDVKLRPDWFTSEATSLRILVGRAGSAIENLPRFVREKSLRFLFRFFFLQRVHPQQPPSFPNFVKSARITTLVRTSMCCPRFHAWHTAKKWHIAKILTCKCFQWNTIL